MELFRALGLLAEAPGPGHARIAALLELGGLPSQVEYTATFTLQLYPYASVYLGPEGMLGGEARDRVAGFWRALGSEPPIEPDHLAALLGLYAELHERETGECNSPRRAALARARAALLGEHLLPWVPVYARKMQSIASEFYRNWAALTEAALAAAASGLSEAPLPLHLREAPAVADPRESGADTFVATLLAPVRSGLIIARDDLTRAAREMKLGARYGERRFTLTALLAQDREATLEWLENSAHRAADEYATASDVPRAIRSFWCSRAASTATLIAELRATLHVNDAVAPSPGADLPAT